MTELSTLPHARLLTAFGTVLFVDVASGELRHGPMESSPVNTLFVADPGTSGPHYQGWLVPTLEARDSRLFAGASSVCPPHKLDGKAVHLFRPRSN